MTQIDFYSKKAYRLLLTCILLSSTGFAFSAVSEHILSDEMSLWHNPANSGHSGMPYSSFEPLRVRAMNAEYYFRTGSEFAGSGSRYGEIKFKDPKGELIYLPRELHSDGAVALRLLTRKSNPRSKWRIGIMRSATSQAHVQEGDKHVATRQVGQWTEITIPLAGLAYKKTKLTVPSKKTMREPDLFLSWHKPGNGNIFGLKMSLQTDKSGDILYVDRLSILRSGSPSASSISGNLQPVQPGARIVVNTDKGVVTKIVDADGRFSVPLPLGAKKGEIYAETTNQVFSPTQGRFFEVGSYIPVINIPTVSSGIVSPVNLGNFTSSIYDYSEPGARIEPFQHFAVGVAETKQLVSAELKSNSLGYIDRDRRYENPDKAYRVFVLGECHHMGVHIAQADNWWNEAEGLLSVNEPRPVEIISASFHYAPFVNGWPAINQLGSLIKPDMIILPLIDPEVLNVNVEEYVSEWLSAIPGHLPTYQFESSKSGETIKKPNDPEWLVYRSGMPEEKRKAIRKKYYSWEYVQTDTSKRPDWVKKNLDGVEAGLREFAKSAKLIKTRVVVLYISDFHLKSNKNENGVSYKPALFLDEMRKLSQRAGVEFVDISPQIHRVMSGDDTYMHYYRGNGHWTPYGHFRMGQALSGFLKTEMNKTK